MGYTIWPDGIGGDVLYDIHRERGRQEHLRETGKFRQTCAAVDMAPHAKLAVLAEEFGEVARHVTEYLIEPSRLDDAELREELIQVAAVAAAWAESLGHGARRR